MVPGPVEAHPGGLRCAPRGLLEAGHPGTLQLLGNDSCDSLYDSLVTTYLLVRRDMRVNLGGEKPFFISVEKLYIDDPSL